MRIRFNKKDTRYCGFLRKAMLVEAALVLMLAAGVARQSAVARAASASVEQDYIKWVDFNVSYEALDTAYRWDVDTHEGGNPVSWIDLLAITAAKTGGEFDRKALSILEKTAEELAGGKTTVEKLAKDLKYYDYYKEAYGAVLGGMVGEFEEERVDENGVKGYHTTYGLKAFFPLAKGFDYTHYDDFGAGRSFGYKRKHLGHDMMGQIGTPIEIICRIECFLQQAAGNRVTRSRDSFGCP